MRGIRFVFLLSVGLRRLFFIDWPVREASPYPLTIGLLPACIDWRYPTAESMALSMRADVVNTSVVYVVGGGDAEVVSAPGHGGGRDVSEKWMNNHSVPVIMTGMPNEIDFEDAWKHVHIVYLTNRSGRNSLLQLCENRQNTLLAQRLHGINGTEMSLLKLEQMLMQLLFIPSDIVRRLAHKRVTGNGNGLRKYIAVHARTGVDIGEGRNKRLGYIATHLAEAAERLYRCVRNTTTTTAASSNEKINVFLASDSNELKTRFLDLASTANDVTMEVMTDFRRSLHIDRRTSARKVRKDRMYSADEDKWMQVKWTYDDSGTDKKKRKIKKVKDDGNICLGFFDVFADVFALAQAESLVQFPSGFAVTAQTFGRHKIVRELTGLNEEDEEDDNKDECV